MKRSTIGWFAAAVLAIGGSAFAYLFYFAGGSGEPTTELTTPTIPSTTVAGGDGSSTTAPEAGGTSLSFEIDQSQSTARFELDEELQGEPTRVVGTTDQVVGLVTFDSSDLSTVAFSDIVINARTLATDSDRRDRAIRGPVILDSGSDENELITFVVTSVDGLSGEATVGDAFVFSITGDLSIKGETNSVTFDVDATLSDESTLEGTAQTTVLRSDFGIGIPSVPGVANVSDEVLIVLDFTAVSG